MRMQCAQPDQGRRYPKIKQGADHIACPRRCRRRPDRRCLDRQRGGRRTRHQGQGPRYRGDKSLRRHDRGGSIMRTPLMIALVLLGACAPLPRKMPSGCDEFRRGTSAASDAALAAPDRLALASEQGTSPRCRPSGWQLALRAPREAQLPSPPERAPSEGTFAGFAKSKGTPKAGLCTVSLSASGWVDLARGRAFSEAKGISVALPEHADRHPQMTMKYAELAASHVRAGGSAAASHYRSRPRPAARPRRRCSGLYLRNPSLTIVRRRRYCRSTASGPGTSGTALPPGRLAVPPNA